jgi:hypothetical protein
MSMSRDNQSYFYEWREFGTAGVVDKLPVSQSTRSARIRFYGMLVDEMGFQQGDNEARWETAIITAIKEKNKWELKDGRGATWKLMKMSLNMVDIGYIVRSNEIEEVG